MARTVLAVIGGSGLYDLEGLEVTATHDVDTPWGAPSDTIVEGEYAGVRLLFLPRHGRGHFISPSEVPYRANIDALKRLGATDVLSISSCGSFREEMAPGTFVVVDQYVDRTKGRPSSFFGTGLVAHVSMAQPVCEGLSAKVFAACEAAGVTAFERGTYLAMEGPQFGTLAESNLYRAWGMDVVGMTGMPEAKLAREAELPYACCAMITDYDCWHEPSGAVDVASVLKVMGRNGENARAMLRALIPTIGPERTPSPAGIEHVLDTALITAPDKRDPALLAKLDAVAGRVLG
ncbi:S-methyl-5'-thioadenosine phosphorylase [Parvularcula dongshanensis]|uniref:Purine nucleoside phosphorylase n=1 Tax=Parvularcula dongshanensis TaxID=1173995 RepID=A0A840I2Q9_9PROT|nr:S-methyl-5'-thioadenosine phosphorylase [Parvularcula dongshanensis]MBB4659129.1 5'-methylthioadenosine phosphorylase [Parvularcula dongshanensis]